MRLLHITKTGGTSLSDAALEKGIRWGYHDEAGLKSARNGLQGLIGPLWHQPLECFHKDFVRSSEWFVVCRDPIDRAVSEANCIWEGFAKQHPGVDPTPGTVNLWMRISATTSFETAHWHPQWYYAYPENLPHPRVFRFEELAAAAEYLGVGSLPRSNEGKELISRGDLTASTLTVLREVYAHDFRLFGYPR